MGKGMNMVMKIVMKVGMSDRRELGIGVVDRDVDEVIEMSEEG